MANSGKSMKRMESRKSHSWWWDSHISPKNSKWLAENLEEMDRSVKRMLKLIEEDADSFAKKAEMYYRKRPELVALVEEFYRMYRSLAERYDHVTGELRKNVLSDLQTQGSGVSDAGSDFPTSPDHRQTHRKPGSRAAGFDFFLGSGGNSADMPHEGDESSSLTDSEPDSDASSVNNYASFLGNGSDSAISRKINELEFELREAKQKLQMQQEDNAENSFRGRKNENNEDLLDKVAEYEQELRLANERIRYSEEEISRLKIELQKFSPEYSHGLQDKDVNPESGTVLAQEVSEGSLEASGPNSTFPAMMEALRSTKAKLEDSEKETANLRHELEDYKSGSSEKLRQLQDQLELAKKEITTLKSKLNKEKKDVARLQERVAMLKSSLTDRDHEIRDLKMAVSDAEQKIFPEKAQIKAEMSKLLEQQACFEVQVKESESRCRSLEEEIRRINAEKAELKERLESEIKWLQEDIAEKVDQIEILNESLDASKQEKDELNVRSLKLEADVNSRDHQIAQMNMHLHRLHVEQAQLIASAEEARKLVEDLKSKTNELEKEIERQRVLIREGAEEKREAIRQLCFSLDHYRNNYHRLRRAFTGHKRVPVLAS